ncbi:MAG: hypothetical protein Q9165_001233 [Trypethelium subeluteriae]
MSEELIDTILHEIRELYPNDNQQLSSREQNILDLYNEQAELELETALLNAQNDLSDEHISEAELQEYLRSAEQDVTEARASYTLRNKIIQDILITDPLLKAVHAGSNATQVERNLLPLLNARDSLSMLQSQLVTELRETHTKLSERERANLVAVQKNRELTQELMELVEQTKPMATNEIEDPGARAQLASLERDIKPLEQKWRVLKSLLAGAIVGSGVDWARDPVLRDLVLDDEDEMV